MAEFTGKNGNILQFPLGTFPAGDLPTIALYANLMISDDLVSTDCSQVCGGSILYTNDTSRHHVGYVNMPRYNPFLVLPIAD